MKIKILSTQERNPKHKLLYKCKGGICDGYVTQAYSQVKAGTPIGIPIVGGGESATYITTEDFEGGHIILIPVQ